MSIAGLGNVSVLSGLYTSGQIANNPSGSGSTISSIRDQVDKLATSGQLTSKQQIALIAAGFQDLNANDPSYQPAGQTGYTRSTNETIDFSGTLKSIGAFDASHGDLADAATFSDLADRFKLGAASFGEIDKSITSLDITG